MEKHREREREREDGVNRGSQQPPLPVMIHVVTRRGRGTRGPAGPTVGGIGKGEGEGHHRRQNEGGCKRADLSLSASRRSGSTLRSSAVRSRIHQSIDRPIDRSRDHVETGSRRSGYRNNFPLRCRAENYIALHYVISLSLSLSLSRAQKNSRATFLVSIPWPFLITLKRQTRIRIPLRFREDAGNE